MSVCIETCAGIEEESETLTPQPCGGCFDSARSHNMGKGADLMLCKNFGLSSGLCSQNPAPDTAAYPTTDCTRTHTQRATHRPALVDEVHDERAQKEDEENGDEHVVDGPDVADLKQLTEGKSERRTVSPEPSGAT